MHNNWKELLKEMVPYPFCGYRPFVCRNEKNGSPEAHDVLIIGKEVATNLDSNWWCFWDWEPEPRFIYERFEKDYLEHRRRNREYFKKSRTRYCLDAIHSRGINAVETNASKGATNSSEGIDAWDSNKDVVQLLIKKLPLKSIVAHGDEAQNLVRDLRMEGVIHLPDDRIFQKSHFGWGVSYKDDDSSIGRLCEDIKRLL